MKVQVTIVLLILTCTSSSQPLDNQLRNILDTVISKARETGLHSSRVDWDKMRQEMYLKAEKAKKVADMKPSFEALLNGLVDHHGKFVNPINWTMVAGFTDWKRYEAEKKDKRKVNDSIRKIVNDTSARFSYKLLSSNIGYLKIVGIAPWIDIQKEGEKIRNAIIELYGKKVAGWIIDLRYNFGGTMIPMLAGMGPLLGEGIVGGFSNKQGQIVDKWEIRDGSFVIDSPYAIYLENKPVFKTEPKIAVLVSQYTSSSGEIVAVAFKGKSNTKFFGEATAGYCTATNWEQITDSLIMSISTTFYADRKGITYAENLEPDVLIKFSVEQDQSKDQGLIQATKWLKGK